MQTAIAGILTQDGYEDQLAKISKRYRRTLASMTRIGDQLLVVWVGKGEEVFLLEPANQPTEAPNATEALRGI